MESHIEPKVSDSARREVDNWKGREGEGREGEWGGAPMSTWHGPPTACRLFSLDAPLALSAAIGGRASRAWEIESRFIRVSSRSEASTILWAAWLKREADTASAELLSCG